MAERYLEISLVKRGITCTARLLDDRAPITCDAVWKSQARADGHDREVRPGTTVVDLALFYERNNLLLNGDVGWVPGIVWGQVAEGPDAMAEGCTDLWRTGAAGESLSFRRA